MNNFLPSVYDIAFTSIRMSSSVEAVLTSPDPIEFDFHKNIVEIYKIEVVPYRLVLGNTGTAGDRHFWNWSTQLGVHRVSTSYQFPFSNIIDGALTFNDQSPAFNFETPIEVEKITAPSYFVGRIQSNSNVIIYDARIQIRFWLHPKNKNYGQN